MSKQTTKVFKSKKGGRKMNFVLIFIGLCMVYSYPILSLFIICLFLFCNYIFNTNDKDTIRHSRRNKNIKFGINKTNNSEFIDEDIYLGGKR